MEGAGAANPQSINHREPSDREIFNLALVMGDNCLILGQQISQWAGHAPILEEDIAQANIALDLIGQAQYWLGLAGEIEGLKSEAAPASNVKGRSAGPRSADDLAFLREPHEFRNFRLAEIPNGDYAHTLMRQFLFDNWHFHMLQILSQTPCMPVRDIAGKALKEVTYHLQRSSDLVIGLGDGSDESHQRMQGALDHFWPYTCELCDPRWGVDLELWGLGDSAALNLKANWDAYLARVMIKATLVIPERAPLVAGLRPGTHTEHLGYILADMQLLQRAHPGASW